MKHKETNKCPDMTELCRTKREREWEQRLEDRCKACEQNVKITEIITLIEEELYGTTT